MIAFAAEILFRISVDNDCQQRVAFSDEGSSYTLGQVYRPNVRIYGSENPHAVVEHRRDSCKVMMLHDKVIGSFLFSESTVTANLYLDMLQLHTTPPSSNFNYKPRASDPQQLALYVERHLRLVAIMIEVSSRHTKCANFNPDYSQMPAVALHQPEDFKLFIV